VPGRPTSVSLVVVSGSSLRAIFSAPLDNGGDEVSVYRVEWSTDANFGTYEFHDVLYLAAGAPYRYAIPNLSKGTTYFVRVRAGNTQGFGNAQASTPPSEHPRELPSAPTAVRAAPTSGRAGDGKITVGWSMPVDNGGDPVTAFVVYWDVTLDMNSFVQTHEKGSTVVPVTDAMSYTIGGLVPGKPYFIVVAARNLVGERPIEAPLMVAPSMQRPGRPSSVSVDATVTCATPCLRVQWNHPRVPFHGIFCGGGGTNAPASPAQCPELMGRYREADGGSNITRYVVQWSTVPDFSVTSPPHYGDMTLDEADFGSAEPFTLDIQGLTPGQLYYVRVAAANTQGIGEYQTRAGVIGDGSLLSGTPHA